jgi:hypothetical protein
VGEQVPATEVDHEPPHGGDMQKFWDRSTWRSRCKPHHSAKTRREVNAARAARGGYRSSS